MQKGDVVVGALVPTDQDAPETVQPTMSPFHYPAPGFETSCSFDGLSLLASTADVGGEAELGQGAAHFGEVAAFIQAHTLGMLWAGCRSWHRQAVHRRPYQLHVVAVGPVHRQSHRQSHRNARGFSQQAALDAPLASVGGVGAGFPPRPGETWSWRRPGSANSSPDPSGHHSVPAPPATVPGTPQRQPIPESADGRWSPNRCPWRPRPSTGSPCAARRRCHWRKCGREPGAGRRRTDGCSHARGSGAPALPKAHRRSGKRRWWDWSWWPGQHARDAAVWGLSIWSSPQSRRNSDLASRNGLASFRQLLG